VSLICGHANASTPYQNLLSAAVVISYSYKHRLNIFITMFSRRLAAILQPLFHSDERDGMLIIWKINPRFINPFVRHVQKPNWSICWFYSRGLRRRWYCEWTYQVRVTDILHGSSGALVPKDAKTQNNETGASDLFDHL